MPNLQFPDDLGTKAVPIGADQVLLADSVTGEVRNANLSDLPVSDPVALAIVNAGGGDMSKAVYDSANVNEQLVGVSANQMLTNKTVNGVSLTSSGLSTVYLCGNGGYSNPVTGSGVTPPGTPTPPPTASTVSYSDSEKWIKIVYTNNTYNLYTATGNTHPFTLASGVYLYNSTGDVLITSTLKTGNYDSVTKSITYDDGMIVNGLTGAITQPGTPIPLPPGAAVSFNPTEKWVKIIYTDGTLKIFAATGNTHPLGIPSGIFHYVISPPSLISSTLMAGTYDILTNSISYVDGTGINGGTGVITPPLMNVAYTNKAQTFTEPNTFNNDVIFNTRALFPIFPLPDVSNDLVFDANNSSKQKVVLANTTSKTISFKNLREGCNYEFAIVTTGATTLSKGTIATSGTIVDFYSVGGSFTNGMSLALGVHLFVCETFDTGIHISYLGQSVAL